ncbi:Transcription initiation factor TFIID subunit 13 [Penicillium angulare]|uniref:Transcription initiation factor TFIID subunit 13 n=1 Tax=Penicillium angulare TaxID=116970 RepID=UPI00253FBC84|nr:Transcription initiation factor TFIID subunit 13 [Penicillium angulare]KAJ5281907.1 Transcription initiation factor TFIID subunit 13 [Penicillium angulare]
MSAESTGHPRVRLHLRMPSSPSSSRFTPNLSPPPIRSSSISTSNLSRRPITGLAGNPLSSPSLYNLKDTFLICNGYKPAWTPNTNPTTSTPTPTPTPAPSPTPTPNSSDSKSFNKRAPRTPFMAEPRARAARHKGQMNFSSELRFLLLAYGDPSPHPSFPSEPLPETVRVLDEIVTDFILELCHGAAQVAHHARRQKIKVDDFRFALRRDPNKLGRVQELLRMERELKEARKAFDQNDDQVAKDAGKKGTNAPGAPTEEVEGGAESVAGGPAKKNKGKGKRGATTRRGSDATEESVSKKRKTNG